MLYDYENIWENIVYIQAREESSGNNKQERRSKKWRKLLKFPPLTECQHFAEEVLLQNYDYIVNKQPIGSRLFSQFCLSNPKQYHRLQDFLIETDAYELELEENREKSSATIIEKYFDEASEGVNSTNVDVPLKSNVEPNIPNSSSLSPLLDEEEGKCSNFVVLRSIKTYLSEATIKSVKENTHTKRHDLFHDCVVEIEAFLAGEPFQEFRNSLYFQHYLQWLWIERQSVSMKTFYMYRVLGKGGFGEVCACQTRSSGSVVTHKYSFNKSANKRLIPTNFKCITPGCIYQGCNINI
jgi:G protein-coupled receptor kinase